MAINTETKLPLHVTGKRVLHVISKVVGAPWELDTFNYQDDARTYSFPENPERKKALRPHPSCIAGQPMAYLFQSLPE